MPLLVKHCVFKNFKFVADINARLMGKVHSREHSLFIKEELIYNLETE